MGYKELDVWKLSMELATDIYRLTSTFPQSEQFGLTSQLRRSTVSIPTNIAEGYGRRSEANFAQFLRISKGSVNEIETLLILAEELKFAETGELRIRVAKIGSMLTNLITKVKSSSVAESVAEYVATREFDED